MTLAAMLLTAAPALSETSDIEAALEAHAVDAGYPAPTLFFTPKQRALAETVSRDADLAAFYGNNGLKPFFTGPEGGKLRKILADAVIRAPEHGLPVGRYKDAFAENPTEADELAIAGTLARWVNDMTKGLVDPRKASSAIKRQAEGANAGLVLEGFVRSSDPAAELEAIIPTDAFYTALQTALAAEGPIPPAMTAPKAPKGLWKPGVQDPLIADLRARVEAHGFAAGEAGLDIYDETLVAAVRAFQQANELGADGIAGAKTIARLNGAATSRQKAILIAMERWRWLPDDLGQRHIWVNLTEYSTRIVQDGVTELETRSVIGKATGDMETPEFSDEMEYIVFNPRWNVPRSITVKEYLPRLKANPNAVGHIDIVDGRGNIVPRSQIDFSRYTAANFPYRMRQKPSDDNALGRVKFLFPNEWNIYLHDTPTKHLFGNATRAYSHGCIRLQKPFEMAEALLRGHVDNPAATMAASLAREGEQWHRLRPGIPIHLVYFTTFPDETGKLRHLPDFYGRDEPLWQALEKAGLE